MTVIFILLVIAATSCSPVNVSYDYDRTANFTPCKTYHYSDDTGNIDTNAIPSSKNG